MAFAPIEDMATNAGYNMQDILSIAPDIMEHLARHKPLSYGAFVEQIDKDLNNIINNTESGKQHHLAKGEDAITEHIIVQLKQKYLSVHHDAQQGGHCDIYIEVTGSSGRLYKWVMEAKLWDGFGYVYKGLDEQLLGSYAVGGVDTCRAGMLFYSTLPSGAKFAMDKWYDGLDNLGIQLSNKRLDGLRFCSEHKLNNGSGADFYVNHYCVDLYHAPTQAKLDKAKAKAQAEAEVKAEARLKAKISQA